MEQQQTDLKKEQAEIKRYLEGLHNQSNEVKSMRVTAVESAMSDIRESKCYKSA